MDAILNPEHFFQAPIFLFTCVGKDQPPTRSQNLCRFFNGTAVLSIRTHMQQRIDAHDQIANCQQLQKGFFDNLDSVGVNPLLLIEVDALADTFDWKHPSHPTAV
jgi:hypothetical protein